MRRSKVPAVVSRVFLTILSLLPGLSPYPEIFLDVLKEELDSESGG